MFVCGEFDGWVGVFDLFEVVCVVGVEVFFLLVDV